MIACEQYSLSKLIFKISEEIWGLRLSYANMAINAKGASSVKGLEDPLVKCRDAC